VSLFDVNGAEFDRTGLSASQPLIAVAHFDTNGNGEYDFVPSGGAEDGANTDEGNLVIDVAITTVA